MVQSPLVLVPQGEVGGLVLPESRPLEAEDALAFPELDTGKGAPHFKVRPRKYKELVWGIQGPRGAGKDAFGSFLASCYMLAGVSCYSNTPIEGQWTEGFVKSQNLFASQLFAMGQEFVDEEGNEVKGFDNDCLIYYSEIDKLIHRRRTTSNANMILRVLATQLRKSGISVAATAQDWFWLDADWIYQTDVLVNCGDLAMTAFGHEEAMEEGYVTYVEFFDISGVITGYKYKDTGQPYQAGYFNTRMMWDPQVNGQGPLYDSYAFYGLEEVLTRVVLDKKERHIGPGSGEKAVPTFDDKNLSEYLPRSQSLDAISNAVGSLQQQGIYEIPAESLRRILEDVGYRGSASDIGRKLHTMGIAKMEKKGKGVIYNLEAFHV